MTFLTAAQTTSPTQIPDWAGYLFIIAFFTFVILFITVSFRRESIASQAGFDNTENAGSIHTLTAVKFDDLKNTLASHQLLGSQATNRLTDAWRLPTNLQVFVIRIPPPPLWLWGSSQFQHSLGFLYEYNHSISDSTHYLSSHRSHRGRFIKQYVIQSRVDSRPQHYEFRMPFVKHSSVPILERYSNFNQSAVDLLLQIADSCHCPPFLACQGKFVYVGIQTSPSGIEGAIQHTPERICRGLHEWSESLSTSTSTEDA